LEESLKFAVNDLQKSARSGAVPGSAAPDHLDNGPQFVAKDFKEFIRISGMTHVRTSPFYPQSNGKIEHWQDRSRRSASGGERRYRWRMPGVW
jgi:transposase InsO family protein